MPTMPCKLEKPTLQELEVLDLTQSLLHKYYLGESDTEERETGGSAQNVNIGLRWSISKVIQHAPRKCFL